jgi:hypothetical protein
LTAESADHGAFADTAVRATGAALVAEGNRIDKLTVRFGDRFCFALRSERWRRQHRRWSPPLYERAILIRAFEEKLLEFFALGKLAGSRCTPASGQEIGAVAVARELRDTDWVFSNHRCRWPLLGFKA